MMEQLWELLSSLCEKTGVAGAESSAAEFAAAQLRPLARNVTIDPLGSVCAQLFPEVEGKPTVLLDAHIDEIGLIVTGIDDQGFLRVAGCGGVDRRLMLAQRVIVHGTQPVYGVISAMAPHLSSAEEQKKVPQIDELLIDVGMSREQAQEKISLGDRATICSQPRRLENNRVCAKASDDRAGVAAVLLAARLLHENPPDCGVKILLSVQEETGERGAKAGGFAAGCDIALAVDVSFALTNDAPAHKCGKLGEGPMIGIAPTLTKELSDQMIQLAKDNDIPYQLEVMAGETSTNADALGVAGPGAKTGLLSIPLRYMHTPIEVTQLEDIENTARLLAEMVRKAGKSYAV